jgi:hypothetical protein
MMHIEQEKLNHKLKKQTASNTRQKIDASQIHNKIALEALKANA